MRWYGFVGGIVALVGVVWLLQGIGVLQGSVMTGQSLWMVIGAVALVVGAVLLYLAVPRRVAARRL